VKKQKEEKGAKEESLKVNGNSEIGTKQNGKKDCETEKKK
jgi:hypothetical protein